MSVKALQDYTFVSKYARYNPEKKRRETWNEAVDRVTEMHVRRYPQIEQEIRWAFDQSKQKRVLGSQRALQFGGPPIEKKNARIYNCISSYCDRLRFFQECFWLLLCGCGTGFSVQKHHVEKLPEFTNKRMGVKTFVIPDSIEGWSDALGVLLSSYFTNGVFPEYEGYAITFDYSLIRPEGTLLGSSSGKAPGPKPLSKALEKCRDLLDRCIADGQRKLKPINAYDIIMHASDAVLSGGVRRSATICLFSPDDFEMATAKTGNWFIDNPQRGRSNNSALLLRGKTTKEEFIELMSYVREYGEPGFIWSDSTELVVNPCVTGDTLVTTANGITSVNNLIGRSFEALVDGKPYLSKKGFWETGVKEILELTFQSGRTLKLTKNHKLLTNNGWKEADDISFEDEVVIHNHRSNQSEFIENSREFSQGYCLGNFLADGNVSKNSAEMKWWGDDKDIYRKEALGLLEHAGWKSTNHKDELDNKSSYSTLNSTKLYEFACQKDCIVDGEKTLSTKAIEGSWDYLSGLIAGYFDADGTVAVNHQKGCSVRFTSTSLSNLQNLQIALNSLGVYSKIYNDRYEEGYRILPDGKGGSKEYHCKATHELCISCDNIQQFSKAILIKNKSKKEAIQQILNGYSRTPNRTHFVDKIVNKKVIGCDVVYDCTVEEVHAFDANGVYAHNCVEIGMWPVDVVTGETGWQACNLCEINGRKCKTEEDFEIACRSAAIIGTCQAGYTDLDYLGPVSKRILQREALLGVSITGMMDNPDIIFNPEIQRKMAKLVLQVNETIANKIGINPAARATCVKPAGTTSCILGTASGIHPHHAKRYIRRSQSNHLEAPLQHFKKFNQFACEKSVWSANGTDEVVSFCIEVPNGAKTKNDFDAIKLLEYVKLTQQNWVQYGTRKERCTQSWLVHNVSNTISIRPDEWDAVTNYIYENREFFAGISLLSINGDKDYPQAPFTTIHSPSEIVKMYGDGSVMASGLIVDALNAFNNNLWKACEYVLGKETLKESEDNFIQSDWIRRAIQFADRYFEGDVHKMTYCLKDVSSWKQWCDLKREYKEVDYTTMIEDHDDTKIEQTIACAGGVCQLSYA